MTEHEHTRVWDLPVRVFHWGLAASFVGAYALADTERWRHIHIMLGYTALGLIAFRLCWGFLGTRHARFRSFAFGPFAAARHLRDECAGRADRYVGHNPAGSWAVYGLLLLGTATGVTGYLHVKAFGGEVLEDAHEVLANAWLALVVLHVLGVVFSSVMQRENLIKAMVTGRKRGAADGPEPPSLRGLGIAVAATVVGFWAWSLATPLQPPPLQADSGGDDRHEHHSELAGRQESDDD
jgi:cytochrome b